MHDEPHLEPEQYLAGQDGKEIDLAARDCHLTYADPETSPDRGELGQIAVAPIGEYILRERASGEGNGEIAGFIALLDGFIGGLFVSPENHRLGIGKQLVRDAASRKGELEVEVYRENPRALAFYAALGFRETGEKPLDDVGRPHELVRLKREAEQS